MNKTQVQLKYFWHTFVLILSSFYYKNETSLAICSVLFHFCANFATKNGHSTLFNIFAPLLSHFCCKSETLLKFSLLLFHFCINLATKMNTITKHIYPYHNITNHITVFVQRTCSKIWNNNIFKNEYGTKSPNTTKHNLNLTSIATAK